MYNSSLVNNGTMYDSSSSCSSYDSFGNAMIPWIYNVFGECIHSPLEQSSFYVGLVSIGLWMCALFPQIIANFKNRDASSLSAGFLSQNVIGDASNLLACVLSGQLITQILLASYFVSMDFILVFQYLYYVVWLQKIRGKKLQLANQEEDAQNKDSEMKNSIEESPTSSTFNLSNISTGVDDFEDVELKSSSSSSLRTKLQSSKLTSLFIIILLGSVVILMSSQYMHAEESLTLHSSTKLHSRKLLNIKSELDESQSVDSEEFIFPPNTPQGIIGYVIGCICAIMYVGSRLPQIYWNFKRKSTDGLSPTYFSIGIFGNMCYLTSIWLFSVKQNYLLGRLPWLTESTINIFLDTLILSQYYYYTHYKRGGSMKYSDLESKGVSPSSNIDGHDGETHSVSSHESMSSVTFHELVAMHELAKHLPDDLDDPSPKSKPNFEESINEEKLSP